MKLFLLITLSILGIQELSAQSLPRQSRDAAGSEKNSVSSILGERKNSNKKTKLVLAGNTVAYGTTMAGLYASWYKNYPFGNFHFTNDNKQWLQVDKAGHAWSGYIQGRAGIAMWRWAGLPDKKAIWVGGLTGFAYQNIIEIIDGLSSHWGFSWGDYLADIAGSGLVTGQELGWKEQRVLYKFSAHRNSYNERILNDRANDIYGTALPDRLLNDYNAQTYWLSINLKSFFKKSNLPAWLNIAVGYGAAGMFGETDNKWKDANDIEHDRSDIKRSRQFYISPDIDFSRIKTKSKFLKTSFFILNSFKFPAPSLEFSNNRIRGHWFIF
jgi:Predicted periplasmic lipoprotein (DUF2279)